MKDYLALYYQSKHSSSFRLSIIWQLVGNIFISLLFLTCSFLVNCHFEYIVFLLSIWLLLLRRVLVEWALDNRGWRLLLRLVKFIWRLFQITWARILIWRALLYLKFFQIFKFFFDKSFLRTWSKVSVCLKWFNTKVDDSSSYLDGLVETGD